MAILPIHVFGSPVLREEAAPVTEFDDELRSFIADMFETMDTALGIGLAANQEGVASRIAVIVADDHSLSMVIPITAEKCRTSTSSNECCLSIPEPYGL